LFVEVNDIVAIFILLLQINNRQIVYIRGAKGLQLLALLLSRPQQSIGQVLHHFGSYFYRVLNFYSLLDGFKDIIFDIIIEAVHLVILDLNPKLWIDCQILSDFVESALVSSDIVHVLHVRGHYLVAHNEHIEFEVQIQKVLDCHLH
jgi:hypothetical protein